MQSRICSLMFCCKEYKYLRYKIMFTTPQNTCDVSLRLSKVLDEIGVNEKLIQKRRNVVLTEESIHTISKQIKGDDVTMHKFGSRSEGSTTSGLMPDSDTLVCNNRFNIIQDLAEWKRGLTNLLMVRDSDTPPGYCLLQRTYDNAPTLVYDCAADDYAIDKKRRVLMRNTWFVHRLPDGCFRHGPSQSMIGGKGFADDDLVYAYRCKSWPREAKPWLQNETIENWPSIEMRRSSSRDGCFVVPVGQRGSENEDLQWRISTSLTERRLMFSLNVTQMRCYVLMKMILKSYPNLVSEDILTSFICKAVLIHCIGDSESNIWQENNLLKCLNSCLKSLYDCVSLEHCSHFIIPDNNLMAGRILPCLKPQVKDIIHRIISSNGKALLEIEIDQLGMRLSGQFTLLYPEYFTAVKMQVPSADDVFQGTSVNLFHNFTIDLSARNRDFLSDITLCNTETVVQILSNAIDKLGFVYLEGDEFERRASKLLTPSLSMSLGSVLASRNISVNRVIPREALTLFTQGFQADISSTLKQAAAFYCTADTEKTINMLMHIEERYNLKGIQPVCCCFQHRSPLKDDFKTISAIGDLNDALHNTAFCVRYLPCEVNCIPDELQHELFRSDTDTHHERGPHDCWMDWAVVDAVPFFYFLQYKVYSNLGDKEQQQTALRNLQRTIDTESGLGHQETALNLLGQLMEQENRLEDALHCYTSSLNIRPANNAANSHNIHILQKIYGGS